MLAQGPPQFLRARESALQVISCHLPTSAAKNFPLSTDLTQRLAAGLGGPLQTRGQRTNGSPLSGTLYLPRGA